MAAENTKSRLDIKATRLRIFENENKGKKSRIEDSRIEDSRTEDVNGVTAKRSNARMQAYRIKNWKKLAEVNSHGKPAKETDKRLKKTKPKYARWSFQSHSLSPVYKRLAKKAYSKGKLMEAAAMGLFVLLIDIAMDWDNPKLRSWILDDLKRPLDGYGIADLLEMRDREHVIAALDLLADPEIGLIELVEFDIRGIAGESGETRGNAGERGEKAENSLNNETVTESINISLNETEKGETGETCTLSRPPSVMDSVLASGVSDSVSDMAPRAGGIGRAKNIYLNRLQGIIAPKGNDVTTFRDIAEQLSNHMMREKELDLFELSLSKAREAVNIGRVPAAMFVAAMKEPPFNYRPKGTSVIPGRWR